MNILIKLYIFIVFRSSLCFRDTDAAKAKLLRCLFTRETQICWGEQAELLRNDHWSINILVRTRKGCEKCKQNKIICKTWSEQKPVISHYLHLVLPPGWSAQKYKVSGWRNGQVNGRWNTSTTETPWQEYQVRHMFFLYIILFYIICFMNKSNVNEWPFTVENMCLSYWSDAL